MKEEEPDEVGDNVVGEDQGFSEEDESRINEVSEGVNDGGGGGVNAPVCQAEVHKLQARLQGPQQEHQHQQPQQQVLPPPPPPPPPCPVVHWERFLPVMSLKVLLVENDDSTRQVVSALLRNCSYEVTAVSNGLEAWKILKDLTNHIDIVLTEVVMPCLSGVGLLGKIMCHKTCKNIPVIMMSSHDSMGLVFKCLSRGAVDFLVKPIRKNELKNLWQHIWRRCHSSSGSGSESGTQTQKSVKSKNTNDSDNSTGSNNEDDNSSIGLNTRDGSDNGSGTQNSWTKLAAEPDSPQPSSPWNQLAEAPDSTCAQVIHPKPQTFCNHWVANTCSECQEQKEQLDGITMAKDPEMGVSRNPDVQLESYPSGKVSISMSSAMADNSMKNGYQSDDVFRRLDVSNATCELTIQAADLLGTIAKSSMVTTSAQASNSLHKITRDKDMASGRSNELQSLELSLKRLRSIGGGGITSNDDHYVLRCSDHSAFSRYNTFVKSSQKRKVYGGSCSVPLNNGSEAEKMESMQNATPLNKGSKSSCNINDVSSTSNYSFNKPTTINQKVSSSPTTNALNTTLAFNPMKQQNCATQCAMPQSIDNMASTKIVEDKKGTHHVQVQHHHQHYHHHHHHVHVAEQQLQQLQPPSDHDELSPKDVAVAAPPCGSSNMFSGLIEATVGNYSLNGSVSGSNHGSNGQNGSSTMNPGGTNMESDNGLVGKDKAGGYNSSGKEGGGGVDQNRFEQRVAALTKFRQKRKQRCFQKKVRYQSRKRLAEQRPRVRGQFVRQIIHEHTSREADC